MNSLKEPRNCFMWCCCLRCCSFSHALEIQGSKKNMLKRSRTFGFIMLTCAKRPCFCSCTRCLLLLVCTAWGAKRSCVFEITVWQISPVWLFFISTDLHRLSPGDDMYENMITCEALTNSCQQILIYSCMYLSISLKLSPVFWHSTCAVCVPIGSRGAWQLDQNSPIHIEQTGLRCSASDVCFGALLILKPS